jgi:hypothetical protein
MDDTSESVSLNVQMNTLVFWTMLRHDLAVSSAPLSHLDLQKFIRQYVFDDIINTNPIMGEPNNL